ncbi:MAG TPA: amino acid permease [Terriglobales bacterium]|nr:amino acid permease [Terriglobales bacterium]
MHRPAPEASTRALDLARDLKVSHATAIVVGTIIGSGIFLVPSEMMQAVGSSGLVYLAWIVGGLLSFFGALTYAELGAMKPEAGGEYVYVRDGIGPLGGFLYGWTYFLIAKPASLATIVTGFVRIIGTFAPLSFLPNPIITAPIQVTFGHLVAVGAITAIAILNYIGVKKAGEFQLFFTILKVVMIASIIVGGFTYSQGAWANLGTRYGAALGGFGGFMTALIAALWAYDGWNLVTNVSSEIKEPQRSLPIALIAGVAIVGLLYMGVNAAVQFVMPANAIAASPRPASEAMAIAWGSFGAGLVSAGMALSMLVTLNGSSMTGARIPFALSRDGYFFHFLAKVHPRFRTPSNSVIVQAVLASLLVVLGGNFQQLFSLALYPEWLFYLLAASSIFIFRKRNPDAPRPYKTWGYPVVPALFILAAAVVLVYTFQAKLVNSLVATAVILAGIPVYSYFSRQSRTHL